MQIKPQQPFPVVRQLGDPTDNSTNYVQAVVRDSLTGQVLATLDLNDMGSQRFELNYLVPADISGLGYYIDITTIVYTDSGYTSKNVNYSIENACYLALQPLTIGMGLGGGGGVEVDYRKIEKLIKAIEFPKQKKVVLDPFFKNLSKEIASHIKRLESKETDFSGVVSEILKVGKLVSSIEIPEPKEPEKVDLMPVIEGIQNLAEALGGTHDKFQDNFKNVQDFFSGREVDVVGQLKEFLDSLPEETNRAVHGLLMLGAGMKKSKKEEKEERERPKPEPLDPKLLELFESPYHVK